MRDYNRRSYGNPLFNGRKQAPRSRRKNGIDAAKVRAWTLGIVVTAAVAGALWYLFWGPAFAITNVTVNGASGDTAQTIRSIVDARMAKRRLGVFPESSIFLLDKNALQNDVRAKFFLDDLQIRKKMPHTLTVDVKERAVVAALVNGNRFLAVDENGEVIRELSPHEVMALGDLPDNVQSTVAAGLGAQTVDLSQQNGAQPAPAPADLKKNRDPYPVMVEKNPPDQPYAPGDRAVSASSLAVALAAYARLPDLTGSGVKWFVLDDAAQSVEAVLRQGWSVYLSTDISFDVQSQRLALILKDKVKDRQKDLQYIDLRYNERIFFRFKDGTPQQ